MNNSLSTWVEIDLDAIAHNCNVVRNVIHPDTKFMAVVKADGYGHGSIAVSRVVLKKGADFLGVARIEEAIELRENNIDAPILILGFTPFSSFDDLIRYNLTQTIYSVDQAKRFSDLSKKHSKRLKCHIKVDTGMGRLGIVFVRDQDFLKALEDITTIVSLPGLNVEGIYTHFAQADSDKKYTLSQLDKFLALTDELKNRGVYFSLTHAANSAALLSLPESHLDMVRAGIMLYGVYPSEYAKANFSLKPAMTLKSKIAMVKEVGKGFKVSYGSTYTTWEKTKLATVCIGYGDGYPRLLSSRADMLIKGKRVKVVGRVCMDYTIVDVKDLEVDCGDEVVIFGAQGDEYISVEELARLSNTIGYEVLTSISKRVKRVYKGNIT